MRAGWHKMLHRRLCKILVLNWSREREWEKPRTTSCILNYTDVGGYIHWTMCAMNITLVQCHCTRANSRKTWEQLIILCVSFPTIQFLTSTLFLPNIFTNSIIECYWSRPRILVCLTSKWIIQQDDGTIYVVDWFE